MSKAGSPYDFIAKLLIIGDSGVGKTCLLLRFCDNNFTTSHLATIGKEIKQGCVDEQSPKTSHQPHSLGIDFKLNNIEVLGKKIKMQIWDTAGQERFKTITQTYYKGAMGIVLAYSCNDAESFKNVDAWMTQIKKHASSDIQMVLVGNKCDMPDRAVSTDEGKALADKYGIPFFETSAKEDIQVTESFHKIAELIVTKLLESPSSNGNGAKVNNTQVPQNDNIKLNSQTKATKDKKGGCC